MKTVEIQYRLQHEPLEVVNSQIPSHNTHTMQQQHIFEHFYNSVNVIRYISR